ncbi:MAG: ribonuclease P protein component [Alphaproteobacteria bacterium]|nr:ribonuclease P protein component [Alphaproteobacteria bacterium]
MTEAPQRLKRRHQFLRVARGGKKCAMPGLVLQAQEQPPLDQDATADNIRIGFTVSRKVGNAVVRNRARRRLRAAADVVLKDHAAEGHDYVIIGRAATPGRKFDALVGDLEGALQKLDKWQDGNNDGQKEDRESI